MLYIVLGSGFLFIADLFIRDFSLYQWLIFDKKSILEGQVWRLVTWVFTDVYASSPFMALIGLYFFYFLGRHIELSMGTLKFNLFYFSGVVIMALFAMIFAPGQTFFSNGQLYIFNAADGIYIRMAYYMHLSLLLTFCIANPDAQFLVLFIIPVKAWFMSLVYLFLIILEIYSYSTPVMLFPHNLFPLMGLLNFVIYAGKDVVNLLPPAIRPITKKKSKKKDDPIQFRPVPKAEPKKEAYNHKCTVCGRTDVSNPELEFRYCSRCHGYHCYCQDHISNHTHIEE